MQQTRYDIHCAAVIGAGTMGRGIAMSLASAGIEVLWLDKDAQMLEQALGVVADTFAHNVRQGRIDEGEAAARRQRIRPVAGYAELAEVDLVIEAVYENLALKQAIFGELDGVVRAGAILASNTSALDIDAIAAVTKRPEQVLGLHFFSPAHIMKLLEIVRGAQTDKAVLDAALELGRRMGKVAVVSGNCPGFIGNRMLKTYVSEARAMLLEGAYPHQVDAALQGFGFAMGPFRMYDVVGIDLEWRARELAGQGQDDPLVQVDNRLCALGRFGQKSRMGYYRYAEGSRQAEHDPKVDALVQQIAERLGYQRRAIGAEEIVERCLLALVNEGAKILEEGIASKAGDIDMVYLTGYGFPIHRGGPMHYASEVGLFNVVQAMKRFARNPLDDARAWEPAPLLARLAAEGKAFA